ncbi:hypothetical protein BGZ57DRAFT_761135 [Hyaloscypha finlandica]|nr:hypothetical protein BGZ57DRAFT_761135 [Hyaloscypha finlandica]
MQSGSRGEIELPIQTPTLADLIVGSYAIGVFDNPPRVFLPQSFLSELITKAAVAGELEENLDIDNDSGLVNYIVESAKRVFATAIISAVDGSNLYMLMKRFQENEFDDRCLPLKRNAMLALSCFQGKFWNEHRTHKFLHSQWVFLAPVFSKSQFKIDLEPEHIFPFTWVSNVTKEGACSIVYQATIHESHQEDPTWMANVAIKKINGGWDLLPTIDEEEPVNKEWEAEARALDHISGLNHRNIYQRIAAIKRGKEHYFMFEWADGGSLEDFWKDNPRPNLDPGFIKEIVMQLRDLADALHELHNYGRSYRHGDLKPEKILRFKDATRVGVLKIAGMGLVRRHTELIWPPTGTRYGSVRYEPPEVVTHKTSEESRSRLYDIWSMGCITLEIIVWLLYGYHDLMKFNDSIKSSVEESSPYFKVGNDNVAKVHPVVRACMDHIFKDPECTGNGGNIAIRDLLHIVKTNLLVIHPPPLRASISGNVAVTDTDSRRFPAYQPFGQTRATASHFRKLLDDMIGKGKEDERYWFTGISRENLKGPPSHMIPSTSANRQNQLVDFTARMRDAPTQPGLLTQPAPTSRQNEFPVDNSFANSLFNDQNTSQESIQGTNITKFCGKCSNMDLWLPQFRIEDTLSELEQNSANCDFCKFRWQLCKDLNLHREIFSSILFDRRESMLRIITPMERYDNPVLSICRSPDPKTPLSMLSIQIGLPQLPAAGSDQHLRILRLWLKHCDENHPGCRPLGTAMLPTRLIDVGGSSSTTINLYETQKDDTMKYIALSHPWGAPPHFCTFTSNIEEYKRSIDFAKLPITFQNAVSMTRELGYRYLWIDSICIIQGPDGDFNKEAKRMEDVFGSAYCVLAASSAKGQSDGFLKKRDEREHLTFIREGLPPFYICRFIDDFGQHVLEGSLNKRGWVLQERALARRTIYFTNKQTYWECGSGVRCETLAKMHHKFASFVGDPNFPEAAIKVLGGKIPLYQNLYTHYSRLKFPRYSDRPIAIAGLEKLLIRTFDTRGGFGVFDDGRGLLHRSLLWNRGSDEASLDKITSPADSQIMVPTWSWMAFKGGIDYLDLPFDGGDLEEQEIRFPWTPDSRGVWPTGDQGGVVELSAVARDLDFTGKTGAESKLIYDHLPNSGDSSQSVKCVIVGRLREDAGQSEQTRIHYVLLVTAKASYITEGALVCERVGVGHLLGQWIRLDQPGIPVRIR